MVVTLLLTLTSFAIHSHTYYVFVLGYVPPVAWHMPNILMILLVFHNLNKDD